MNYRTFILNISNMTKDANKYAERGVSANKTDVHQAIHGLDKGLFPTAFCKILPDFAAGDSNYCNIMHADTAGTKTGLAYLYWKETGDLSVWKGIVQDAIVMNLDDMACVGCYDNIILSSTIGRNKRLIPGEILKELIQSTVAFINRMKEYDINIHLAGGETADVGDIVRTIDVGYTAFGRMRQSDLLINNVLAGDVIVGFSSSGQANYEDFYNSGIGCNGLTSARHDLFEHSYAKKYPESFEKGTPDYLVYSGSLKLTDKHTIDNAETTIGKLALSPTRTYIPLIKKMLELHAPGINGLIHCTGGGQTKVLKFVKNKHIIKNNLFTLPDIFQIILKESKTNLKEMYQVFNMGHRLEAYCDKSVAENLIEIANSFGISAQIIGYVEESSEGEKLTIETSNGTFNYES